MVWYSSFSLYMRSSSNLMKSSGLVVVASSTTANPILMLRRMGRSSLRLKDPRSFCSSRTASSNSCTELNSPNTRNSSPPYTGRQASFGSNFQSITEKINANTYPRIMTIPVMYPFEAILVQHCSHATSFCTG